MLFGITGAAGFFAASACFAASAACFSASAFALASAAAFSAFAFSAANFASCSAFACNALASILGFFSLTSTALVLPPAVVALTLVVLRAPPNESVFFSVVSVI